MPQLPHAEVHEVDQGIARLLATGAVVEADLQEVRHGGLVVHGDVGAQRAELGDLGLDQRPDALFPGLTRAVRMVLKRERPR